MKACSCETSLDHSDEPYLYLYMYTCSYVCVYLILHTSVWYFTYLYVHENIMCLYKTSGLRGNSKKPIETPSSFLGCSDICEPFRLPALEPARLLITNKHCRDSSVRRHRDRLYPGVHASYYSRNTRGRENNKKK